MHTMRLRAALVAVCLCLSACTGGQLARWLPWYKADPAAAMTAALSYGEVKAAATDGHPCPEWYGPGAAGSVRVSASPLGQSAVTCFVDAHAAHGLEVVVVVVLTVR